MAKIFSCLKSVVFSVHKGKKEEELCIQMSKTATCNVTEVRKC